MEPDKSKLRKEIRELKRQYDSCFASWSEEVCRLVASMPFWKEAQTILLYHALSDEPNLQSLLETGLLAKKQILLPVVVGDELVLRSYRSPRELRKGAFGIFEPVGPEFPVSRYNEINLALIPGVAFDPQGHRLGRGRGYYDRLLPRLAKTHKLGICFPFQIIPYVPAEPHDIPVDEVVDYWQRGETIR